MLNVKNLCFNYGKQKIYENFNLSIPRNQVCLITGINGVGKSTLLRLMAGVLNPKSGEIVYSEHMGNNPRQKIGFISDKLSLYKDVTVQQAVDLHLNVYKADAFDDSMIKHTKIERNKKVKDLSIGQQTILHLSLILSAKPDILLLDEVIQPLDAYLKKLFIRKLIELISQHQTTIVLVNLNFHDIEHMVDRVILLKNGKIHVDQPIEELKEKVKKVVAVSEPRDLPIISTNHYVETTEYYVYPFEEIHYQREEEFMDLNLTEIVSAFIGGEYAE